MKQQLFVRDNYSAKRSLLKVIVPLVWGMITFLFSCEQGDIEKINSLTSELGGPDQTWTETEMIYTLKGKPTIKIISPKVERYESVEEPYIDFPDGIFVQFYDSLARPDASVKSNYAIYYESEGQWVAENNVVAISQDGDTLNTEYLVWDMKTEKMYSDRYVRVTNEDGIIHGKGFEADQDMGNLVIKQTTGTLNIKNEK